MQLHYLKQRNKSLSSDYNQEWFLCSPTDWTFVLISPSSFSSSDASLTMKGLLWPCWKPLQASQEMVKNTLNRQLNVRIWNSPGEESLRGFRAVALRIFSKQVSCSFLMMQLEWLAATWNTGENGEKKYSYKNKIVGEVIRKCQ